MQMDYFIQEEESGKMNLFDITGRLIKSYNLAGGNHTLTITDNELQNGVYFYRVNVNGKMVHIDKIAIIK